MINTKTISQPISIVLNLYLIHIFLLGDTMKEKFIKSTIILVIGGFITKILGMLIRIITTRYIGTEGIGLYMLVLPSFNLFITIATFSLPISISKIVAEESRNNKILILGIIPIALIFNIILILLIIYLSPIIATNLLSNSNLKLPIIATSLTLPFITLSSIIRGYFFGKQKMIPHVTSNIIEQIIRIICIILITPILLKKNIIYAVTSLVIFNIISEMFSIIVLLLFLPKKVKIKKSDLKFNIINTKDIFNIAIPNTTSRLISAIGLFLEPIIITFVLLKLGFSNDYITNEYGIISGYVLPMVSMPSFLSGAISNALLPVITKYHTLGKKELLNKKIKQAIFISLAIGLPFTIILMLFPNFCLDLIFNNIEGSYYLRIAAPIYLISYIQGPIISALQAMNKSKIIMKSNIIGVSIKTIALFLLTFLNIGMRSFLYAILIYNLFITIYQIKALKKDK